jgi:hypothetical protein
MTSKERPQPVQLTFEQVTEAAKEHLLVQGSHPPLLVLDGEADQVGIELDFPSTSDRRQELMYVAGLRVARTGVVGTLRQMFLITEAWMSEADSRPRNPVAPSEDPKRREILLISSLRLQDRQARAMVIEMLRDSEGVLRELKDITPDISSDFGTESPLLNALVDGYTQGRASRT